MNEHMPLPNERPETGETEEEQARRGEEMLAAFEREHPTPESKKDHEPIVAELESLIAKFENEYSLEELHAITTEEEARRSPLRLSARDALDRIVAVLATLKYETNIPAEELQRLTQRYRPLSQAVGMINSGKVDHTR